MTIAHSLIVTAAAAALLPMVAFAGPASDFEHSLRAAYGSYRVALFATNSGNAEASGKTLARFADQWKGLAATYASDVPPPYEDAAGFAAMITEVGSFTAKAQEAVAAGKLAEAHEELEQVREAIGDVRERAGVIGFSDRVNAYHAEMEEVLGNDTAMLDADGIGRLREQAAVLAYLADQIVAHPAPEAADPAYAGLLAAFRGSVEKLQAAARAGDADALKAALAGLKPAYAKFFVKFG